MEETNKLQTIFTDFHENLKIARTIQNPHSRSQKFQDLSANIKTKVQEMGFQEAKFGDDDDKDILSEDELILVILDKFLTTLTNCTQSFERSGYVLKVSPKDVPGAIHSLYQEPY